MVVQQLATKTTIADTHMAEIILNTTRGFIMILCLSRKAIIITLSIEIIKIVNCIVKLGKCKNT